MLIWQSALTTWCRLLNILLGPLTMNRNANRSHNTSCFRWITNMTRWQLKSQNMNANQGSSVAICQCCWDCHPTIQKKSCYKMCVWDCACSVSWWSLNYVTEFVFETILCYWHPAKMELEKTALKCLLMCLLLNSLTTSAHMEQKSLCSTCHATLKATWTLTSTLTQR